MNFVDRLIEKIKEKKSSCVVGLDPMIDMFPNAVINKVNKNYSDKKEAITRAIVNYNKEIIDAVHDQVPAVKPQSAYYEIYGSAGIRALEETCNYAANKGLIVIIDAKRNDIGSTAQAYSEAYLNNNNPFGINVDGLTVNGYLGSDGIIPFINDCKIHGKGIFILVKTSNKSSGEIQDLKVDDKNIYEKMAENVNNWGMSCLGESGYSSIGAVVGATFIKEMKLLRELMPKLFFLVPGYGTQGGSAQDVKFAFNSDGNGALISASRSIMYAYKTEKWNKKFKQEEFAMAARAEVENMRNTINNVLG